MANVGSKSGTSASADCATLFLKAFALDQWVLLDVEFSFRVRALLMYLWLKGFGEVRIAEGRRTIGDQQRLYGLGRTARQCKAVGVHESLAHPEAIQVTWILPFDSKHVDGHAVDLYLSDYGERVYASLRSGCKIYGLTWGGTWKVGDYCHVESK